MAASTLYALAGLFLVAAPLALGCTSTSVAPACNALLACCNNPNMNDPSSCTETAQSLTDGGCGMQLEQYQASGACPAEAGVVPAGDAGM